MSLTKFLKTPEAVKLYESFPVIEPHLFYCKGKSVHTNKKLVVPRVQGADPAVVGTAYDFCCRAITQRINGILIEKGLSTVLEAGLRILSQYDLIAPAEVSKFRTAIEEAWNRRIDYIKGELVPINQLVVDALLMARVEQACRSGRLIADPATNENVEDLINLCMSALTSVDLLQTKEKIYMNPTFGKASRMVGGADADMVFGTTLIDIKTTVHTKSLQEYFEQLFGYYLLSDIDKTFNKQIQYLAAYLPRFDTLYFISLDKLRSLMNVDAFAKQFLDLAEGYR